MLFALDIGNTQIKLAVFAGEGSAGNRVATWRIPTDRNWTAEQFGSEFAALLQNLDLPCVAIDSVAVSSVVPALNENVLYALRQLFPCEPFVVGPDTEPGIGIQYHSRASVGADRICNAVGAFARYGGPAIVVDYGTATKFDVIATNGDFIGGAILPGIAISINALYRHAPHLPRVEFVAPPTVVGHNTLHALQSGIVHGFAAQTDAMIARIRQELGTETLVIATGGFAEKMHPVSHTIQHVDSGLTLDGLRLLYVRNATT